MTQKRGTRGMGSVYKTQDGVWKASRSLTVLDPATGQKKRKRITGTGSTKSEAIARLDKRLQARAGGAIPSTQEQKKAKTLFRDWFEQWLASIPPHRVSDIVRHGYRRKGELYLLPYIGDTAVEDLDTEDLRRLFDFTLPSLTKPNGEPQLSTASRLNVYRVLQMCLTEATRTKSVGIVISPLAGVKPPVRDIPKEQLGDKIGKTQGLIRYMRESEHPDYCRFLFQWLGLRRSERLGLTWDDVKYLGDAKRARIEVRQQIARYQDGSGWYLKKPKTKASVRTVPLVEPFLSALRQWKNTQDGYKKSAEWSPRPGFENVVFLKPSGEIITPNRDNEDWHDLLTEYLGEGVPHWRGHLNRHITATLLAQNGVSPAIAQKVLGHASEAMTAYYTSITTSSMVEPLAGYGTVLTKRATRAKSDP